MKILQRYRLNRKWRSHTNQVIERRKTNFKFSNGIKNSCTRHKVKFSNVFCLWLCSCFVCIQRIAQLLSTRTTSLLSSPTDTFSFIVPFHVFILYRRLKLNVFLLKVGVVCDAQFLKGEIHQTKSCLLCRINSSMSYSSARLEFVYFCLNTCTIIVRWRVVCTITVSCMPFMERFAYASSFWEVIYFRVYASGEQIYLMHHFVLFENGNAKNWRFLKNMLVKITISHELMRLLSVLRNGTLFM